MRAAARGPRPRHGPCTNVGCRFMERGPFVIVLQKNHCKTPIPIAGGDQHHIPHIECWPGDGAQRVDQLTASMAPDSITEAQGHEWFTALDRKG